MTPGDGRVPAPQPDPKVDRYRAMVRVMRVTVLAVTVLAIGGTVLGGPVGEALAAAAVVVVLAAPLVRVLWLAVRWFRRGDARFGSVALGVLAVIALGAAAAAI